MANYFKDFFTRLRIQWIEWRAFNQSIWNVKRDKKQIERAIYRAKIKNKSDGKTYHILKNIGGGFDEVTWEQAKLMKKKGIKYFPLYRDYYHMLTLCFAIVTSSEIKRNSYVETINNINKENHD